MNPWKLILATVVIFGAGVVMGGLLVNYVIHANTKTAHHSPVVVAATNHPPVEAHPAVDLAKIHQPEILSQQFVEQLDDVLQLTPPQRDAIQKIIAAGQEQNHCIWTNCAAQSRQVLQEVRQHIKEQLTPDQVKQFEKLMKQARPVQRRTTGTNSPPALPSTNPPAVLTTNIAGQ